MQTIKIMNMKFSVIWEICSLKQAHIKHVKNFTVVSFVWMLSNLEAIVKI